MFYLTVTAEGIKMLSTNNNDYDHIERERQVLDLYKQGKSTRDIAKELRASYKKTLIEDQLNLYQPLQGLIISTRADGIIFFVNDC